MLTNLKIELKFSTHLVENASCTRIEREKKITHDFIYENENKNYLLSQTQSHILIPIAHIHCMTVRCRIESVIAIVLLVTTAHARHAHNSHYDQNFRLMIIAIDRNQIRS